MFWMFKLLPNFLWYILLILGILATLLGSLKTFQVYETILKGAGILVTICSIFILGMLYADNTWKQAAKDLETKIEIAKTQSETTNKEVKKKLVTKVQIVKEKQDAIIKYIDREIVKPDPSCVIPKEFIDIVNSATEPPK